MSDSRDVGSVREFVHGLGATLEDASIERLVRYLDAILEENQRINLTAVRERDAALSLHVCDSLAAVKLEGTPATILDLGTGNGFPGVALACAFPAAQVVLLDRTQKKLAAIERALASASFDPNRITTTLGDAAQMHAHGMRSAFDLIAARAVGPPERIITLASPLMRTGGRIALWLAEETVPPPRIRRSFAIVEQHRYALPEPAARERQLVVYARQRRTD